ncbi:MAG: hypothetical protein J3K34DRAFT_463609 [Monoraphidium minutum]|nr:MAG: hypothetical protein J3K34DRAFT_463609 [Monoraphidium minutum]
MFCAVLAIKDGSQSKGFFTAPAPVAAAAAQPLRDDLDQLLQVLPAALGARLAAHPRRPELLEVVLDLGRRPEARFAGGTYEYLGDAAVAREELEAAAAAVGSFGSDNRAGVPGTLHRVSAIRNRRGDVVGLTCRVGRAVTGHVDMIRDILAANAPVLFLGRPGVGKTTVIREIARVLSEDLGKRVVIVDTSNEIGGDGDVPHPAIGAARRMQVPDAARQHHVMIEAVENHMPQVGGLEGGVKGRLEGGVVIVDEIGTEAEALACRTIAERGVTLIGTAHGCFLENLIKNPTLADLAGGVQPVTLGDEEAARRGCKKSILERGAPPTFPVTIEMRTRGAWVAHDTAASVDALLSGRVPEVQLRRAAPGAGGGGGATCEAVSYDRVEDALAAEVLAGSPGVSPAGSYDPEAAAAGAAAAGADALLAAAAAAGGAAAGALRAAGGGGELPGADPTAWAERLRALPEEEAMRQLSLLRYFSGDGGALRPRGRGGFMGAAAAAGPAAARGGAAAGGGGGGRKRGAAKARAARPARR